MKFLLSTGCFYEEPIEKSLYIASSVGFDGVELILNEVYYLADAESKISEFGKIIKITAFHAPFTAGSSRERIQSLIRSLELAEKLKVDVVVFHPPMKLFMDMSYWRWFRKKTFDNMQNLNLCVENMPYMKLGPLRINLYSVHRFSELKKMAQDKGLKIAFDTTHCGTSGKDLIEAFEELGSVEMVKHIHLSDFKVEKGMFVEHLPPGMGDLELKGFLKHLKISGYRGTITLEVSPRFLPDDDRDRIEVLKNTLRELKEACNGV